MNGKPRPEVERPEYWQRRYEQAETGWDIGRAEPSLLALHDQGEIRPGRLLIPACGYGWEATAFAALGYDVTAFDFAETPIAAVQARASEEGVSLTAIQADLFALPGEWDGGFDIVMERACYCAIAPERRDDYVRIVHRLLKPGGKLVGLFYVPDKTGGGPPFPATEAELQARFSGFFTDVRLSAVDHFFGRLGVMTKAPTP